MSSSHTEKEKKELNMLQIACNWHKRIAKELENPILPERMDDFTKKIKLEEIKRQRTKHLAYSSALKSLIAVRVNQKEDSG
jgi:hypothetical protein